MQPQHRALALGALVITATALAHADWPTLLTPLNPAVLGSTPFLLAGFKMLHAHKHTTITQHAAALAATPILLARSSLARSSFGMPEFSGFTPSQQMDAANAADGDSDHPEGLPGLTDADMASMVAALGARDGTQQATDSTAVPQAATTSSAAASGDVASTQPSPNADTGTPSLAASSSSSAGIAQAEGVTEVTAPTHATTSSLAEPLTDPVVAPEPLRGSASSDAAAQAEGVPHSTASSATSARDRQRAGARSAADPAGSTNACGGNPAPVNLAPAATRWEYYFPVAKRSKPKMDLPPQSAAVYPIAPPLNSSSAAKTAVCSTKPPALNALPPSTAAYSVCRVYLTNGRCTGFFVGENYVATAGHCVSTQGSGAYSPFYNSAGTFGNVCCRTQPATETCQPEYSFAIIGMVTTCGWLYLGQRSNDGAVLLVRKVVPVLPPGALYTGLPSNFSQVFVPAPAEPLDCPAAVKEAAYAGYPGSFVTGIEGCFQAFEERLFYTKDAPIFDCTSSVDSASLTYFGSGCPGMSGGPVYDPRKGLLAFGIVVVGAEQCQGGVNPFVIGASAITNVTETWGVCASCLIGALAGNVPSSPPSPPFPPFISPFSPPPPPPSAGPATPPSPSFSLGGLLGKKHKALLDDLLP